MEHVLIFFSIEDIQSLANKCGLEIEECYYIQRQYANRKQQQARYRVWLHAKLVKKRNVISHELVK